MSRLFGRRRESETKEAQPQLTAAPPAACQITDVYVLKRPFVDQFLVRADRNGPGQLSPPSPAHAAAASPRRLTPPAAPPAQMSQKLTVVKAAAPAEGTAAGAFVVYFPAGDPAAEGAVPRFTGCPPAA